MKNLKWIQILALTVSLAQAGTSQVGSAGGDETTSDAVTNDSDYINEEIQVLKKVLDLRGFGNQNGVLARLNGINPETQKSCSIEILAYKRDHNGFGYSIAVKDTDPQTTRVRECVTGSHSQDIDCYRTNKFSVIGVHASYADEIVIQSNEYLKILNSNVKPSWMGYRSASELKLKGSKLIVRNSFISSPFGSIGEVYNYNQVRRSDSLACIIDL